MDSTLFPSLPLEHETFLGKGVEGLGILPDLSFLLDAGSPSLNTQLLEPGPDLYERLLHTFDHTRLDTPRESFA